MAKDNGNGNGNGEDPKPVAGAGNEPAAGGDGGSGSDEKKVTMTQTQLDEAFQRRVERAQNSTAATLLKELGYEDVEAAKTALEAHRKSEREKLSEQQKLQSDLDTASTRVTELEGELEKERAALKQQRLRTEVENEARKAAFLDESLDDVWLLVDSTKDLSEKLSLDEESGKIKGAAKVVKKVAEMRPHWVQQQQRRRGSPAGRGTPPAPALSDQDTRREREVPLAQL